MAGRFVEGIELIIERYIRLLVAHIREETAHPDHWIMDRGTLKHKTENFVWVPSVALYVNGIEVDKRARDALAVSFINLLTYKHDEGIAALEREWSDEA